MTKAFRFAILSLAALAAGCTASGGRPGPIDVTRYHLGTGLGERTTISVEPMAAGEAAGPEFQLYADAVAAELTRLGYVQATSDRPSGYIALVGFQRATQGYVRKRPPVTIGIGGGSFGGNVGVSGGASFGIGGGTAAVVGTELQVQLRRRSDNSVVWEGRAVTEGIGEGAQPAATAQRLANALFRDFPGESGITITVK